MRISSILVAFGSVALFSSMFVSKKTLGTIGYDGILSPQDILVEDPEKAEGIFVTKEALASLVKQEVERQLAETQNSMRGAQPAEKMTEKPKQDQAVVTPTTPEEPPITTSDKKKGKKGRKGKKKNNAPTESEPETSDNAVREQEEMEEKKTEEAPATKKNNAEKPQVRNNLSDDLIPEKYLMEMGQHSFEALSAEEASITWMDGLAVDDSTSPDTASSTSSTTSTTACYLSPTGWKRRGHGVHHWTMHTTMACRDGSSGGFSKPKKVLIRFEVGYSKELNKRMILSEEDKNEMKAYREIYRDIKGNWTKDQVHRHFNLPLGMVDFSFEYLQNGDPNNPANTFNFAVDTKSKTSRPGYLRAGLYELLPGKALSDWAFPLETNVGLENAHYIRILQDLVALYQHMYQQRVVNCDVTVRHLFLNSFLGNTTAHPDAIAREDYFLTMIDLQYSTLQTDDLTLGKQTRQLLGIMGKMCVGQHTASTPKMKICNGKEEKQSAFNFSKGILPALRKCPFVDKNDNNKKPKITAEIALKMVEDSDFAYQQLNSWIPDYQPTASIQ